MQCVDLDKGNCSSEAVPGCEKWGILPSNECICRAHFDKHVEWAKGHAKLPLSYLQDYARIYVLFEKALIFRYYVQSLNKDLDRAVSLAAPSMAPDPSYVRLSEVLQRFEQKCWFPSEMLVPMGILDGKVFLSFIRLGYVYKDYGAGVRHGEFTHRVQWHVIMRAMTDHFREQDPRRRGWNHTPLDLYTTLGKPEAGDLWARLLDNNGMLGESLRFPDAVHKMLITQASLQTLNFHIMNRQAKRREEFVKSMKEYIRSHRHFFFQNGVDYGPQLLEAEVSDYGSFLKYEIRFANHIRGTLMSAFRNDEARVKVVGDKIYDQDVPKHGMEIYRAHKLSPEYQEKRQKKGKLPYMTIVSGAIYKIGDGPLLTPEDAERRVKWSYTGFAKST